MTYHEAVRHLATFAGRLVQVYVGPGKEGRYNAALLAGVLDGPMPMERVGDVLGEKAHADMLAEGNAFFGIDMVDSPGLLRHGGMNGFLISRERFSDADVDPSGAFGVDLTDGYQIVVRAL